MIGLFEKYYFLIIDNFHICFLAGFVAAVILTIIVKKTAVALNIVDIPNKRKMHAKPMPLLGGVGIFLAFMIYIVFFIL